MNIVVSPWPEQKNGIGDYAYELAHAMHEAFDLITESPDCRSHPYLGSIFSPTETLQLKCDQHSSLFHIGNNQDCCFVVEQFLMKPGTVILHDPALLYLCQLVGRRQPGFLAAQLEEAHPQSFEALLQGEAADGFTSSMYRELRCVSWLKSATSVIVHSEFARNKIARYLPKTEIHVVPHFAYPVDIGESEWKRRQFRETWQVPDSCIVFLCFGFSHDAKLIDEAVRSMGLVDERLEVMLVLAGADGTRARKNIGGSLMKNRLLNLGYVDDNELGMVFAGCDAVICLRYPSTGESSGSVSRALGWHKPVIVSDAGAFSEIPEAAAFHLSSGPRIAGELASLISSISANPELLAARKFGAILLAKSRLNIDRCAGEISRICGWEAW